MEQEHDDLFDEAEELDSQDLNSEESESEPTRAEKEYFLEVNDRTRYKTPEDAKKAFDEAGRTIASYSRYGKPDELSSKLERLKLLEELAAGKKPGGDDDPLADLPPEQRKQWESYWSRNQKLLERNGYVQADKLREQIKAELQEEIREQHVRTTTENTVRSEATRLLEERGIAVDAQVAEIAIASLITNDPELNQRYFAGDGKWVAEQAITRLYGAAKPKASKERDENGKFKAADYQEAKDKTKQLKTPPKGNTSSAEGRNEAEERKKLMDPAYRLRKAKEMAAA